MDTQELNIINIITNTINSLFSNLFSSIDNNLYTILDDLIFVSTDIISDSYIEKFLGTSSTNGLILISNALLIGFVLYYATNLLISYLTFSEIDNPSKFVLRTIIFAILMNSSYFICEQILYLNSTISLAICDVGENIFNKQINFSSLIQDLNSIIYIDKDSLDIFSFDGLIKCFISIGLLNLVLTYALRYIMIKVFILISPFAFLCLINNKSKWFFSSWLKCFLSLLFLQTLISLILLVAFSISLSNSNIFSKIMYIGAIYALTKANIFIKEFMGGISTNVNAGMANFRKLFSGGA